MRHWAPGGHLAAPASGSIGGGLLVAPQFGGRVWRLCGGSLTFPASLQMGTNKCASQSGMTAYGTRRHLYDPKNHILPPMDHSTISLQMGTNKCASQVGRPSSPRPPALTLPQLAGCPQGSYCPALCLGFPQSWMPRGPSNSDIFRSCSHHFSC